MDEKQLEQLAKLKTMLRSLVVSSPTPMDVNNLKRDYREMMGGPLPFFELGYKDIVTFLKERCADIFIFSGSTTNPTLVPIITDKISHIDNFVSKQKIAPRKKCKGKRARVYESNLSQSSSTQSPSSQPPSYNTRKQINSDNLKNVIPQFKKEEVTYDPKWTRYMASNRPHIPKKKYSSSNRIKIDDEKHFEKINDGSRDDNNKDCEIVDSHDKAVIKDDNSLRENLNKDCDINHESTTKLLDGLNKQNDDTSETDSGHNTGSIDLCRRSSCLHTNLTNLIKEYPDGIWSIELPKLYRVKYDKDLDFERRGFSSVIALCRSLPQVFTMQRPEQFGDWLLMDANASVSPSCRLRVPQVKRKMEEFAYKNEDALPGIDYDPSIYPPDCLHHLESVPRAELPQVNEDGLLEVIVSEVSDPEHFWFQLRGMQHSVAMEAVMDEMAEYYIYGPGRVQSMVDGAIRVGQYCAACYQGDWHRAIIVQPLQRNKLKVLHIDYGTVERIHKSLVRPLPRIFASLPAQAIRGRLGGLRPVAHAPRWPHRSAQKLLALVSDKALVASVQDMNVENQIVTMSLINTLGEEDIYIADELIKAGVAEAIPEDHGTYEVACTFPPFDALESGKALNYADRAALIRSGLCPDDFEDCSDIVPKPPTLHSRSPLAYLIQEAEEANEMSKCTPRENSQTVKEDAGVSEIVTEIMPDNDNYETLTNNSVTYMCNDPSNSTFTPLNQFQVPHMQCYQKMPNYTVCPPTHINPFCQQYFYHQNGQNPYQVGYSQLNVNIPPNLPPPAQTPEQASSAIDARVELSMIECEILNKLLRTNPVMAQRFLDDKRSRSISMMLFQRQNATSTQSLNSSLRTSNYMSGSVKPPPGYENVNLEKRNQNTVSNLQDSLIDVTDKMNRFVLNNYAGNKFQ